jgi:CheY-like chemotaxis protein
MESNLKTTQVRTVNILLVEDDAVDVMNVQRAFQKRQISSPLYVAGDGLEAMNMLRGPSPKVSPERLVILLDLNMPAMNGIEFLRELRADPKLKSIPVIVLTTSNQDDDLTEAYRLNVAGYLLKPVAFADFVELMVTMTQYWNLCEMP